MRGSEGSSSSFSRSRRTCTVTVDVSPKSQPQTRRSRSALLKVCPGLAARKASRSNSRLVKDSCELPRVATWPARSIVRSPIDKVLVQQAIAGEALSSPQQSLDPEHHLTRTERLDHIVVGAGFQSDQAVLFFAAGGQDDHGRVIA